MTAGQIIELLSLKPHPEGGHFIETFRDATGVGARTASTAIYFLLMRGERSNRHRIDAAEVWHYYAGTPLELEVADTHEGPLRRLRLGTDFSAGERPQAVLPRYAWQSATSLGPLLNLEWVKKFEAGPATLETALIAWMHPCGRRQPVKGDWRAFNRAPIAA